MMDGRIYSDDPTTTSSLPDTQLPPAPLSERTGIESRHGEQEFHKSRCCGQAQEQAVSRAAETSTRTAELESKNGQWEQRN